MATPLRYVVIGAGALTVACADLLSEHGHQIVALASPDRRTRQWARAQGIACAGTLAGVLPRIQDQPFDYLLSIVNFRKIPEAILRAPRFGAINYHDAPLPRYAGSHAVTWALVNGETRHAVSWHVMTDRVDAGDLLVQTDLAIWPRLLATVCRWSNCSVHPPSRRWQPASLLLCIRRARVYGCKRWRAQPTASDHESVRRPDARSTSGRALRAAHA
ncbi:hypothetical protein GCM10027430_11930 [Lysobacter tyrosinilyticus]